MKLSDYVAKFCENQGISHAFVLTGGCIVHMIDSVAKRKKISYIPVAHEQAGSIAADGFSRSNNSFGLVMATSGPGATNLLTGICCSYYDSVPLIAITGQVPRAHLKRDLKTRQIGFQETDVISIYKSVTKYSVLIDNPKKIRYELEKAFYIAKNGRPGPVLLDICDDVQRANINPNKLKSFIPPKVTLKNISTSNINKLNDLILKSKRPIIIFGAGVRMANAIALAKKFKDKLGIPYISSWGAIDFFDHNDSLFAGGFGVTSTRAGNFAVQNSDLIISIGCRLDTHEVGSDIKTFAREAKKVIIDIDINEQKKYKRYGIKPDLLFTIDAKIFLQTVLKTNLSKKLLLNNWIKKITDWKIKYPSCSEQDRNQKKYVNPYFFMESLSKNSKINDFICTDTGATLIWTMQGLSLKKGQRVISAWNHSPMGYSLPASIGVAFASQKRVICLTGDGGLQLNIQELATIVKHKLNIIIIIMNNHCYGIIQGTQESWLDSSFHASDPEKGKLTDPNFSKIAKAYGIKTYDIFSNKGLDNKLESILNNKGPILCNVHLEKKSQIHPKLLFGRPIEDAHPLLSREEFYKQMIVKPIT
jgi:acetolactate synthase-1/2/3 large subunit